MARSSLLIHTGHRVNIQTIQNHNIGISQLAAVTDESDPISTADLIGDFLPPDWDNSPSRESQIQAVVHAFLTETNQQESIAGRRQQAQQRVADRENVEINTIQSKCGRETWEQYVDGVDYQREYFDPALELMEEAYQTDLLTATPDTDLFVMPVSEDWLEYFAQTVDTPFVFGPPEDRPSALDTFGAARIWGTTTGERNASTHGNLSSGDIVLFSHDELIFAMGRVQQTITSSAAGSYIWDNEDSKYIYTLVGYQRLSLPKARLWDDVEYAENFTMRGFKRLSDERVTKLWDLTGDLDTYFEEFGTETPLVELTNGYEALTAQTSLEETPMTDTIDQSDYDIVTKTAPYYWVNQNDPDELSEEYLQAPVSGRWMHDMGKLEVGDIVFNFTDGEIIGYSEVTDPPYQFEDDDGDDHWRVEISITEFDEPAPLHAVLGELLEDDNMVDYYPVNQSGINAQYLYNLSEGAAQVLFEAGGVMTDPAVDRLTERLTLPTIDVALPSQLYFHPKEAGRLEGQINAALNAGNHIIFTGPPGTGKSKLAKHIAAAAVETPVVDDYLFTTATAEWTTFDTIGGYVPSPDDTQLDFDPRLFLRCFRDEDEQVRNQWLLIDELNRANIDKALGPLFSVLSGDSVQLPYERTDRIEVEYVDEETSAATLEAIADSDDRFPVTPAWRIIGTMNTFDKTSLYELSYAFMRRFTFIHVGVPPLTVDDSEADGTLLDPNSGPNYATKWIRSNPALEDTIETYHRQVSVIWAMVNQHRSIGPSIVLDMFKHLTAYSGGEQTAPLTSAITSLIFPQLEGLRQSKQEAVLATFDSEWTLSTADNESEVVELDIDVEYLRRKASEMYDIDLDE